MKRVTLIATLFALFLLLGCGGGGNNAGDSTPVAKEWQGVVKVDKLSTSEEITNISIKKGLSVNKNGNAALIWIQPNGGHKNAFASFYDFDNNSWSTPAKVDLSTHDITYAKIVLNDNNDAVAAWIQKDGSNHKNLYLRKYTYGVGWSTSTHLLETNSNDVLNFDLAFVGNNAAVTWVQKSGSHRKVFIKGYKFQTDNVGGSYVLNIGTNHEAYVSKVGVDDNGNIMVAWTQEYSSHINLYARRYNNSTSSWETIKNLEHYTSAALSISLDMNKDGDVAFSWMQSNGTHTNTYTSIYDHSSNSYSNQVAVDSLDTPISKPTISINKNSDAIAAWRQKDSSGHYSVFVAKYKKSTNSWSTAKSIEDVNDYNIGKLNADIDKNGNAVVIWTQKNSSNIFSIYANYFDANENSWSGYEALENIDYDSDLPIAKMDDSGNVIAAWVQNNSAHRAHLYSNVYR